MAFFFLGLPFPSNGAQIYKGDLKDDGITWEWTQVLRDGLHDPNNYGIRKFKVAGEYLYAVTANHITGFELWRTKDGEVWEVVMADGFGDNDNTSGRGLSTFEVEGEGRWLYVGSENRRSGAKIFRRALQSDGDFTEDSDWKEVVADGLGNRFNLWFSDFAEYNGHLYTGTLNPGGMQLWRTRDGTNFEMLVM